MRGVVLCRLTGRKCAGCSIVQVNRMTAVSPFSVRSVTDRSVGAGVAQSVN